jgi:hypothetical protein
MNNLHIGGNMNNNEDKGDSMKDITKLDVYGVIILLMTLISVIAIMNERLAVLIVLSLGVMAISLTIYSFVVYLMIIKKSKNNTSDKQTNNF